MFNIDKVKNYFDCDLCHKLLTDPVTTTCGYNVCKKHLHMSFLKNPSKEKSFLKCELCHEDHFVPANGFTINRRLQSGLEIKLNTLKLTLPVYDECKLEILKAKTYVDEIELKEANSEYYIYELFENIKREVDLRREKLKLDIDTYSDQLIETIESTQSSYIGSAKEANQMTIKIEKTKKELDLLIKRFDSFDISETKFEGIKQSLITLKEDLKNVMEGYNDSLTGNKKYSFEFNEQMSIKNIFGTLESTRWFDSVILNSNSLECQLNELCQFSVAQQWKLTYRASRDGFSSKSFHYKCDGIPNTLTIIKSTKGNVFGGFTKSEWASGSRSVTGLQDTDENAFIFSLINKENKPFKAKFSKNNNQLATDSRASAGPTFGILYFSDIYVASYSNKNKQSYSDFGNAFSHPDYQPGSPKSKSILAGSFKFQTVDIEVFTKID